MIQIVGKKLTQWDVDRVVQVNGDVTHVHFANQGDSQAPIIEVVAGEAKIPNYLLQTGKTLLAYAVKDGRTLECKAFAVRKREKPENYIYEDDQRNYIYKLINEVNEAIDNANKVADELREAIEKGEIDVGGANSMTVWVEDGITDKSAGEIYKYVSNNGIVTLKYDDAYYALIRADETTAWFGYTNDESHIHVISVFNRTIEVYSFEYVKADKFREVVGDISTALDHIIELQEELIGL